MTTSMWRIKLPDGRYYCGRGRYAIRYHTKEKAQRVIERLANPPTGTGIVGCTLVPPDQKVNQ